MSYFFLPCSLVTSICFVVSQRGKAGATEAFAFFNLLSAAVMVYVVLTSEEAQWFQLCKKRRSNEEMLEDYETKIKGQSLLIFLLFHFSLFLCRAIFARQDDLRSQVSVGEREARRSNQ